MFESSSVRYGSYSIRANFRSIISSVSSSKVSICSVPVTFARPSYMLSGSHEPLGYFDIAQPSLQATQTQIIVTIYFFVHLIDPTMNPVCITG